MIASPAKPKGYRRAGLPNITETQIHVLRYLLRCKQQDWPFVPLPDVHPHTIRSLLSKDWIFASEGHDGTRYGITSRGEKAFKVYEHPTRRSDGLCPRCGTRPKHTTASGRTSGYCLECDRRRGKRMRALNMPRFKSDICPNCGIRERKCSKTGKVKTYCAKCTREIYHQHLLERIHSGEVILCRRCKNAPRHYTDKRVYDYCYPCWLDYMNAYNRKRRGK